MKMKFIFEKVFRAYPILFYFYSMFACLFIMIIYFDDPNFGFSHYSYEILATAVFPFIWIVVYIHCDRIIKNRKTR